MYTRKGGITTNTTITSPRKIARENAGYTQEMAAPMLHISVRTLQGYESGEVNPKPEMIAAMSALYGVELGSHDNAATAYMNLFKQLDDVSDRRRRMQIAAADGIFTADERDDVEEFNKEIFELMLACSGAVQIPVYDIPYIKKTAVSG